MNEFISSSERVSFEIKLLNENLVEINNQRKAYKLIPINNQKYLLKIDNKIFSAYVISNSQNIFNVQIEQQEFNINVLTLHQAKAIQLLQNSSKEITHNTIVKSPMPGIVLKVNKNEGDTIEKGETILVLEAMKMENEIKSPKDGVLSTLKVKSGMVVEKNILLFSIK